MASIGRHRRAYRFGHWVLGYPFQWLFRFACEPLPPLPEPCIVLANHSMEMDFPLLMRAFPRLMHFVAGENIFRNPVLNWLLRVLHGPITISKAGTDAKALLEMLRRLRDGQSICLFPEGNTCYDGVTGPIPKGTAGLVRASRAHLITYRVHGGYLSRPRWGYGIRRGKTWGRLQGIYSPEQLRAMSDEEVSALIARDLQVDAFQDQAPERIRYLSRRSAQGLEHAVYWCPQCRQIGQMKGEGQHLRCGGCQLTVRLHEDGFFEPGAPFAQLRDWSLAQRAALANMAQNDAPLRLADPGQRLWRVMDDHSTRLIAQGEFAMTTDGIRIGDFRLALPDTAGFAIFRRNRLLISDRQGRHFQLDSIRGQNMLKYRDLLEILTVKEADHGLLKR